MENTQLETVTLDKSGLMQLEQADSPCKKIYFVLQLMYVSEEPHKLYNLFFNLVKEVQQAAPSTTLFISKVCESIMNDDYSGALKSAHELIGYEQKIIATA